MGNLWTHLYRITSRSLSCPAKGKKQKRQDKSLLVNGSLWCDYMTIKWRLHQIDRIMAWSLIFCEWMNECCIDFICQSVNLSIEPLMIVHYCLFFLVLRKKRVWRREPNFILKKMEKRVRMGWAEKMKRDEKMEMETLIMSLKRWERGDVFIVKKSVILRSCMAMFYESEVFYQNQDKIEWNCNGTAVKFQD